MFGIPGDYQRLAFHIFKPGGKIFFGCPGPSRGRVQRNIRKGGNPGKKIFSLNNLRGRGKALFGLKTTREKIWEKTRV